MAAGAVLDLTGVSPGYGIPVYAGRYTGGGAGRVELAGDILNTAQFGDEPTVFDFPPGLFHWTGGTISGRLTNRGTITLSGAADRALNGILENAGTIVLMLGDSALLFTGTGQGSFVNNLEGSLYDFRGNGRLSGYNALVNAGTLRKSGGTGTARVEVAFTNEVTGTVEVASGMLALAGGGTSRGGSYDVAVGATLEVSGANRFRMAGRQSGSGGGRFRSTGILEGADEEGGAGPLLPPLSRPASSRSRAAAARDAA